MSNAVRRREERDWRGVVDTVGVYPPRTWGEIITDENSIVDRSSMPTQIIVTGFGGNGLQVAGIGTLGVLSASRSIEAGELAKFFFQNVVLANSAYHTVEIGLFEFSSPIAAMALPAETLSIVDRLAHSVDLSVVDHEFLEKARAAQSQAVTLVQRNRLTGHPRVMISDDGVLTLQWRNGVNEGAALIFPGDGTVSFALKNAHQTYSDSGLDGAPLDTALPDEFLAALKALVA
jgi:hypothetical protein